MQELKKNNPLKGNKTLQQLWGNLNSRCNNQNDKKFRYYGEKGIKNNLTKDNLLFLWNRDKAKRMKQPSIDRIDSKKDYELENCRFIEMKLNRIRSSGNPKKRLIFDYKNMSWIVNGKYSKCSHPESINCKCFGKLHHGEIATITEDCR